MLENVLENLENLVSDGKRGLKLCDIVGFLCGYVLRGLVSVFRYVMDVGGVVIVIVIGELLFSFLFWFYMLEKGGGVVIFC